MRVFITIALLALTSAARAQQSFNITAADSGIAQWSPRVEHRDGRTYVTYIKAVSTSTGDIFFTSLDAGSQTFTTPVAVTNTGKVGGTLQRGAEVVIAPDGSIHLVWMEQRLMDNPDIWYSRSTNNGMTWSTPADISQDGQRAAQDFPSIAVDSIGGVYVAWIDNRDRVDAKSEFDHIYMTRSLDNGTTWSAPKRVESNPGDIGGSCECCRTSIAASSDGDVYIVYRANMDNLRDIFVARSNDRGESFEQSIRVQTTTWMIHACPATGPMIALDARENLHMVYRSAGTGKAVLYYNLLPATADRTFAEIPLTTLEGSGANYADIAVTETSAINVAYQQGGYIMQRTSTDGGNSWSVPVKVDAGDDNQSFVSVSYDPATKSVATLWQDTRRDKSDIFFEQTAFVPTVSYPVLSFFDERMEGTDSVRLTWAPGGPSPATWAVISTNDTTMTSFGEPLVLPRAMFDHNAVTITPHTAIGPGKSLTLAALSVKERSASNVLASQIAHASDQIAIEVSAPTNRKWSIYDVQGRHVGEVTSMPASGYHELTIPDLTSGVYYLRSNDVLIKLIVIAR